VTTGLCDGAFDDYMVYFSVVISALPLSVEIGVGIGSDYQDYAMSGEGVILLLGFLDLWWRWQWWVGFGFNLRVSVVWHWVGDLRNYWRICYLRSWWRVRYLRSWRMLLVISCGIMVGFVVCRRLGLGVLVGL
jgi:hypothetical protein